MALKGKKRGVKYSKKNRSPYRVKKSKGKYISKVFPSRGGIRL